MPRKFKVGDLVYHSSLELGMLIEIDPYEMQGFQYKVKYFSDPQILNYDKHSIKFLKQMFLDKTK